MNKMIAFLLVTFCCILFSACNSKENKTETAKIFTQPTTSENTSTAVASQANTNTATEPVTQVFEGTTALQEEKTQPQDNEQNEATEIQTLSLQMMIGDTPVLVAWEDNESVQALKELCRNQPLTIQMSMYGGFEQVGSIGADLPKNDVQTTTSSGDIVLYSGNQIVVFYGYNTWAYTRLGHITDQNADGMTKLLSNGDTVITISLV